MKKNKQPRLISDNYTRDGDRVQFDIIQSRRGLQAYNVERFVYQTLGQRLASGWATATEDCVTVTRQPKDVIAKPASSEA
ncbi:unnamed protein product [Didymodactylos carnosus]|nr:unnamed protein product [Didymodactylos carnosus]CAF3634665.1 unnamed protein product [Didymodactylos carnosus]